MSIEAAVDIINNLLGISITLVGPILGVAITVGVAVSLVQTVTSIQEPTLTFVPKLLAIGFVVMLSSHWMLKTLMDFCVQCIQKMATISL